ncbi:hypothetical protein [Halosimplex amylolyticum]|uniref:hypothetical protein n=1 Tax=Halosimplex amylolyticum TaxID=3396616 RepID=UPI003F562946
MQRRRFVQGSAGLLAGLGLAGCLGGNNSPPPRRSEVFDDVALQNEQLQIQLLSDVEVESRQENQGNLDAGGAVASLAPVGVARAAKGAGGRGSGGYSSAPKHPRHGWAIWHGGSYSDDWRDDHRDEIRMYDATVATLAVAYLGSDSDYENDAPGPGPGEVSWDETWEDPENGTEKAVDIGAISPGDGPREGWYRVGTELVSKDGSTDFGWQSVDFEVDDELSGWQVDKAWYVKPRV